MSESEIDALRRRYPIDSELDTIMTRKLRTRGDAPYRLLEMDAVEEKLRRFLGTRLAGERLAITNLRRLTGGASKEQFVFDLQRDDGPVERFVLRADPAESMCETSRLQEYMLMRDMMGIVPVPPVYWVDADGSDFGQPAMIGRFVPGVTKPKTGAVGDISGFGSSFSPEWRERLKRPFVRNLVTIHNADWAATGLRDLRQPRPGTTDSAEHAINFADRLWAEDRCENVPLIQAASNWLRDNMPVTDRISVVHADYRSGNFMFDEADGEVTAILDWELGHLGDRYEDLGYTLQRSVISTNGENGESLVSGLLPRAEFLDLYEEYSGEPIDHKRVRFYEIHHARKCAMAIGTGTRASMGGRMHMNMIGIWLASIGYTFLSDLRDLLQEEMAR